MARHFNQRRESVGQEIDDHQSEKESEVQSPGLHPL